MAYKANRFFDDVATAFVNTDQIGGEIPVGVESATKFRVDVTVTVNGEAAGINLETHVGGDVWIVYGTLSGAATAGVLLPIAGTPLGSKVRLRATAGVSVTKAFITLSR